MIRRLFTIASAMSLILFLGTVALWMRSYWRFDDLTLTQLTRDSTSADGVYSTISMGAATNRGVITLLNTKHTIIGQQLEQVRELLRQHVQPASRLDHISTPSMRNTFVDANQKFGFSWHRLSTEWEFICPMWFPAAIFAILPLAGIFAFLRNRMRGEDGRCSRCGYDLRASKDRCPECGTPIPVKEGQAA